MRGDSRHHPFRRLRLQPERVPQPVCQEPCCTSSVRSIRSSAGTYARSCSMHVHVHVPARPHPRPYRTVYRYRRTAYRSRLIGQSVEKKKKKKREGVIAQVVLSQCHENLPRYPAKSSSATAATTKPPNRREPHPVHQQPHFNNANMFGGPCMLSFLSMLFQCPGR